MLSQDIIYRYDYVNTNRYSILSIRKVAPKLISFFYAFDSRRFHLNSVEQLFLIRRYSMHELASIRWANCYIGKHKSLFKFTSCICRLRVSLGFSPAECIGSLMYRMNRVTEIGNNSKKLKLNRFLFCNRIRFRLRAFRCCPQSKA